MPSCSNAITALAPLLNLQSPHAARDVIGLALIASIRNKTSGGLGRLRKMVGGLCAPPCTSPTRTGAQGGSEEVAASAEHAAREELDPPEDLLRKRA